MTREMLLAIALFPYATLAVVDTWLHERARKVPPTEQLLHGLLALSLSVFLVAAFAGRETIALVALGLFLPVAMADELGFHGPLDRRERRVHFASYAALLLFVCVWRLQGDR